MAVEKPPDVEVRKEIEEMYIVDTDFHALPAMAMDLLEPYLDDKRIKDKLFRPMGTYQLTSVAANWLPTYASEEGGTGLDTHGVAEDGEDVLAAMKEFAVDQPIITAGANSLPGVQYPRMKEEICRAVNDYILDKVTPADEKIKYHLTLPIWNPEAAVEELDRLGDEKDVVGAYAWHGRYKPLLGMPEFDPVYEKLVDLDLPMALHVEAMFESRDKIGQSTRTWTEALGFVNAFYGIREVINMILTGVFDKYPNLKIDLQECGLTWIPYVANRMDEMYLDHPEDVQLAERMFDMDKLYLEQKPSQYLYENFHFSTQPVSLPENSRHAKAMLEMCRADQTFMYSSDWPHHTLDPANWVVETPGIDEELRERILSKNAIEFYGL